MNDDTKEFLALLDRVPDTAGRQAWLNAKRPQNQIIEIKNCSLDGRDISGLNLTNLRFWRTNFSGCLCRNSVLFNLHECVFEWTEGDGASFAHLRKCVFHRASMGSCRLGWFVHDCEFKNTFLRHASLAWNTRECPGEFVRNKFHDCDLMGADCAGLQLEESQFVSCDLSYSRFSRSHVASCKFNDTDLAEANFVSARLGDQDVLFAVSSVVIGHEFFICRSTHIDEVQSLDADLSAFRSWFDSQDDVNIRWDALHNRMRRREHYIIFRDMIIAKQEGAARFGADGTGLMSYNMRGNGSILDWLRRLAADLAGWSVVLDQVKVTVNNKPASHDDIRCVCRAFRVAFECV